jgi:hypothetical protein
VVAHANIVSTASGVVTCITGIAVPVVLASGVSGSVVWLSVLQTVYRTIF